jgi:phosphatidylethanolamine/phosphatidyl-N-methylethanolamine N-methyltransferase
MILLILTAGWGRYNLALDDQPFFVESSSPINQFVCLVLFVIGSTLVLSSFWVLGITGTYLGDYFGILMKEKVMGFPFNVCENPMYTGSVLNLLAAALWRGSPAGVLLALWAQVVYYVAVKYFEG